MPSAPHSCPPGLAKRVPDTLELVRATLADGREHHVDRFGRTYDRTAAESVRPSSENRHTAARFGEMVESVVGRVWASVVDIGASRA